MMSRKWCVGLSGIALLCSFSLLGDGFFTVPLSSSRITVDGKIDETTEWSRAVRLTNFQLKDQIGFAQDQTTVWITHDGKTLYIALKMNARILKRGSVSSGRFRANIAPGKNIREIWDDDSVEVRLRPPWVQKISDKSQYYLITNANAACWSFAPDGQKQDWYNQGNVKASVGDGFWAVEMAFPLSVFGGKKIKGTELENWGVNILRFEQDKGEVSSFANISGKKHTDTRCYAKMTLTQDDKLPAVRMMDLTHGSLNDVKFDYYAKERFTASGFSTACAVQDEKKFFERCTFSVFDVKNKPIRLKTEFGGTGEYKWHSYFVYGRKNKKLFHTPIYHGNSSQGPLQIQLDDVRNIKSVSVNQKNLNPAKKMEFYPRPGNNEILIVSKISSIRMNLNTSGISVPLKWQYLDGTVWRDVTVQPQNETTVISSPAKQAEYKFKSVVRSNASVIELMGDQLKFRFNADGAGYFFWNPLASYQLDADSKITLTLLLPPWLKLVGASSTQLDGSILQYKSKEIIKNHYKVRKGSVVRIGGQNYQAWEISSDKVGRKIPHWDISVRRLHGRTRCLIVLKADKSADGATGKIGYFATVNGIPETAVFRDASCIAALNGIQPKNICFDFCFLHFDRINSPEMLKAQLETFRAAGCNEAYFDNVYAGKIADTGMKYSYFFEMRQGQGPYDIDMGRIFEKYPETRGRASYANLAALNRMPEVWPMIEKEFAAVRKRVPHATNLEWDYEFEPFGRYSSTSPWTLKVFAEKYNIGEKDLTKAVIEKKYMKEWVDFRCTELAAVVPKLRRLANKYGFEFTMFGQANYHRFRAVDSFDWRLIEEQGGLDRLYLGGYWNAEITEEYLRYTAKNKTPVCTSVHVTRTDYTGWKRGVVLRRLILGGGGGVLLWSEKGFDADMLAEIAPVTRLAALYEEFFRHGKYAAFGLNDGKVVYSAANTTPVKLQKRLLGEVRCNTGGMVVIEHNGEFLAMAFNDSGSPLKMSIRMDRADKTFRSVETGKVYDADEEFSLIIPADGYFSFTGKIR